MISVTAAATQKRIWEHRQSAVLTRTTMNKEEVRPLSAD